MCKEISILRRWQPVSDRAPCHRLRPVTRPCSWSVGCLALLIEIVLLSYLYYILVKGYAVTLTSARARSRWLKQFSQHSRAGTSVGTWPNTDYDWETFIIIIIIIIKSNLCKKICVRQHFSSSTRFAHFCTAAISKFSQKIGLKNQQFCEISAN